MLNNPLSDKTDNIPAFIQTFLEGVLKVGIPIIALAIIYSGFLFVEARGNSFFSFFVSFYLTGGKTAVAFV